jgi:hypothetical protein
VGSLIPDRSIGLILVLVSEDGAVNLLATHINDGCLVSSPDFPRIMSAKRPLSSSSTKLSEPQPLAYVSELPGKIASAKAAAAVDAKPPYVLLKKEVEQQESATRDHGAAVVYWMRMQDMRSQYYNPTYVTSINCSLTPLQSKIMPHCLRHQSSQRRQICL